jgi:diguanylate cyclase (GGDEF)-like protein
MKLDMSPEGWGRVIVTTTAVTVLCVAIALYVDTFNFETMSAESRLRAIATDIFVPMVLAVPLMLFFMSKLRDLAIAHRQLTVFASTDSLTQVMNRAAFTTLVDAYLNEVRVHENRKRGALLIIDADNFKSVNDSYGHDRGDEALVTIAGAIKAMLRSPDLVGRIGGEEFGVFLPGVTPEEARVVAERIRLSVNQAAFAPAGAPYRLSVSVGGAAFQHQLPFSDLFRLADQQLYEAKQSGRNRVAIKPVAGERLAAA